MEYKFKGKSEKGSLKLADKASFMVFLQSMEGKNLCLTIKEVKQVRCWSMNQNYWIETIPRIKVAMIDNGFDPEDLSNETVDEMLRNMFLTKVIESGYTDKQLPIQQRTSKISPDVFKAYYKNIQEWSLSFLHIALPDLQEDQGLGSK